MQNRIMVRKIKIVILLLIIIIVVINIIMLYNKNSDSSCRNEEIIIIVNINNYQKSTKNIKNVFGLDIDPVSLLSTLSKYC